MVYCMSLPFQFQFFCLYNLGCVFSVCFLNFYILKNLIFYQFQQNLNGHANLIGYVDSSVTLLDGGIHEVLLLMPYHKTTVLQMMNDRLESGFSQEEILKIFCDI